MAAEQNNWLQDAISKVSVGVAIALTVSAIAWAVNLDRQQQILLHEITSQGEKLDEISKKLEELTTLDRRISQIELTRFTRERGEELERRIVYLESVCAEVQRGKK